MRVFRYRHAMKPYPVGQSMATERSGLLLNIEVAGQSVWSEAAPLPGWSRESIDDVIEAIRHTQFESCPSLHFAHESLALVEDRSITVPLNALLTGSSDDVITQAAAVAKSGYESVKLKVGRRNVEEDILTVRSVRATLRDNQKLRLDANRAWSLHDAIVFGKACRNLFIEYIEEPVADPNDCECFWEETGLSYALDETVVEGNFDHSRFAHVNSIIVKPTLFGGATRIERLVDYGVPLVFSSSFETRIGLAGIAKLAHQYSPGVPAGLDTHRWLVDDLADESFKFNDGEVTVEWPLKVDVLNLEGISL